MLKFTLDGKQLKSMIEKAVTVIDKKASIDQVKRVYFLTDGNCLKIFGLHCDQYASIRTEDAFDMYNGTIGIDVDDLKIITKMTGLVTFEATEHFVLVKNGKKSIKIPSFLNFDIGFIPNLKESNDIIVMSEDWVLETITKLSVFTRQDRLNRMLCCMNFNTKDCRVEAVDGHRLAVRTLEKQTILKNENVLLDNISVMPLKKIMDKKSKHLVTISQDEKYVKVKGSDFTYITRRICGDYFKVNSVIKQDEEYSFYTNKKEMMEIMKYNSDLLKDEKKPNVFHAENGELYSYVKTSRYESLDKINVKQINMRDTFFIGFNPRFIYDALDVIDVDFPKLFGTNNKSPMIIEGKEYTCLVLPVNLGNFPDEENFMRLINKSKVA